MSGTFSSWFKPETATVPAFDTPMNISVGGVAGPDLDFTPVVSDEPGQDERTPGSDGLSEGERAPYPGQPEADRGEGVSEETRDEAVINGVVDATPVLAEVPDFSPHVLAAFCTDVAQNVHTYAQIALRYGFEDVAQMAGFLRDQHMVRKKIKELRAIWESDDNVQDRARKLSGHIVLEALPETAKILMNPANPGPMRMDALKEHAIIAGVRTPGGAGGFGPGAGAGGAGAPGRFSVNIMFANGRTETITATPVEQDEDRPGKVERLSRPGQPKADRDEGSEDIL